MIYQEILPEILPVPVQAAPPLGEGGCPSREACAPSLGTGGTRGAASQPDTAAWYPDIRAFNPSHVDKFTPGYGDAHANCGGVRFVVTCPDDSHHHMQIMRENCKRPACPKCWPGWAARASGIAAQRIDGYWQVHNSKLLSRHISLHPPKGTITDLQDLLDQGRKKAAILGVYAAAVIPHHDRLKPDMKARCEAAAVDTGQNRYEWALSRSDWYTLVDESPHLHMMAYGPLMDPDEFYKKTGWTYRNHDDGAESGRCSEDLKKTLYYLLTHAWVRGNHKVVRYWMGLSTRHLMRVDLGNESHVESCKVCSCDLVKTPPDIVWQDGTVHPFYQDLNNAPAYLVKVRIYRYEIRWKRKKVSATAQWLWGPDGTLKETSYG
ncbi:MAG: hypothetical protein WC294_01500 [Methanoregula sp.]